MARRRRLYSPESRQEFERRYEAEGYSKERADRIFGATVGKVATEQAAERPGGIKVEQVKGHVAYSDRSTRFRVRPHSARIHAHAHPHARGHHRGTCDGECRSGRRAHLHGRRRHA